MNSEPNERSRVDTAPKELATAAGGDLPSRDLTTSEITPDSALRSDDLDRLVASRAAARTLARMLWEHERRRISAGARSETEQT
jgi:hypothetical protein